jgi:hypothetical protein
MIFSTLDMALGLLTLAMKVAVLSLLNRLCSRCYCREDDGKL